jgi:hypothetical protein
VITTSPSTDTTGRSGFLVGAAYGATFALVFALVVRLMPASWFVDLGPRVVLFAVAALAAPPTVWVARWLARATGTDRRVASYGGVIGAATFDGLAIGFAPELYGQAGRALSALAALILFALATVGWADRLMPFRDGE